MQRYGVLYADMWLDEDFKRLPMEAKLVYAYLLSSPHSNMGGYYRVPPAYACEDLRIEPHEYCNAIETLEHAEFIFAEDNSILIRTYLKHNHVANDKQAKGVWTQVERMPLSLLTVEFAHLCLLYAPSVIKFFDGKTIRYLADNHITQDGIDISFRLAALRDDYRLLINVTGTGTDSETEQIQNRTEQNRELSELYG